MQGLSNTKVTLENTAAGLKVRIYGFTSELDNGRIINGSRFFLIS